MNNRRFLPLLPLFVLSLAFGYLFQSDRAESPQPDPVPPQVGRSDPFWEAGCTVIYGADETQALGGNNEDSPGFDTMIWFLPPQEGQHGRVLVGYDNFIWQGGMNDQGLFFDGLGVDEKISVPQGDKKRYQGSLPGKALAECSDVACVKEMFEQYQAYDEWAFQFMFGDASGSSVIIEPRTMIDGGAPFQVATNFYQSRTDLNSCRNCDRYWKARDMFEKSSQLSVDLIRDILDATHLEGDYPTQYSTIYDLKKRQVYLYHFHNFGTVVTFDLEGELSQGYHSYRIEDLFPENPQYQQWVQPELDRLVEKRAAYSPIEVDPVLFNKYLGDYVGPEDFNTLYPYYSIDYVHGNLVLKMLPDKAWMKLEPISDTHYFHVSPSSAFEINFLLDQAGNAKGFTYSYLGRDYTFRRIQQVLPQGSELNPQPEPDEPTLLSSLFGRIGHFLNTNTFKFLGIILGLILLQYLLGVLHIALMR